MILNQNPGPFVPGKKAIASDMSQNGKEMPARTLNLVRLPTGFTQRPVRVDF
jgi:hypothetical protein